MRLSLKTLTSRCRRAAAPWLAALAVVGAGSTALAGPIEVNNASFEAPDLTSGGNTWINDLTDAGGWVGQAGLNAGGTFIEYIPGFSADGAQHIGMQDGYFIYQNTGVAAEPNTTYTLMVGVGNRNADFSPEGAMAILGLAVLEEGATLEAATANDQVAADDVLATTHVIVPSPTTVGAFEDRVLSFTTGADVPAGGVTIFLGDDASAGRAHFDNVRLYAQPAGTSIAPDVEFQTASAAPSPIVLDGDLSEWAAHPITNPQFRLGENADGGLAVFEPFGGGTWDGLDDQSSTTYFTYDADNVYIGVVVTDDYHEHAAEGAAGAWNGDAIQLHVANAARDTQVALYNYALVGVEGALGDPVIHDEAGPGGSEVAITRNGTQTVYEIKLPAASVGLDALTPGTQLGLGMTINDGDNPDDGQAGQKGWGGLGAHSVVFGKTPSETALVTLEAPFEQLWIIGDPANGNQAEFSQETGVDEAPGSAEAQDDDYYFAGTYPDPIGEVAADEPWTNFDRAHTPGDPTNRIHFNASAAVADPSTELRLNLDYCCLGAAEGIEGSHDVSIRINGHELASLAGVQADTLVRERFHAGAFGITEGANTIEIERTGGADSSWIQYDYVSLEAMSAGSTGGGDGAITWQDVNPNTSAGDLIGGPMVTFTPMEIDGNGNADGDFFTVEGGDSGNAELNEVYNSHSWNAAGFNLTVGGLTAGNDYMIQLLGAGDTRGCCADRFQSASDANGNTSGEFQRGNSSVIGSFTAAGESIDITMAGATDPGLSGYILTDGDGGLVAAVNIGRPGDGAEVTVDSSGVVPIEEYAPDFSALADGTTDLGDGSTLSSDTTGAGILNGALRLTEFGGAGGGTAFVLPPGFDGSGGWTMSFDFSVENLGDADNTPADGFSVNYGAIPGPDNYGAPAEEGYGPGVEHVSYQVDTWLWNDPNQDAGVGIEVNGLDINNDPPVGAFTQAINDAANFVPNEKVTASATLTWDPANGASFVTEGLRTNAEFFNIPTPDFTGDPSHGFSFLARVGGHNESVDIWNISLVKGAADLAGADAEGTLKVHYEFEEGEGLVVKNLAPAAGDDVISANSLEDWVAGEQGTNGWTYGYREMEVDGPIDYDPAADFIAFPDTWANANGTWDEPNEDGDNVPWTTIAQESGHPNGSNNTFHQWAIRRYTAPSDGPVTITATGQKQNNDCGNGTTVAVHHNGVRIAEAIVENNQDPDVITVDADLVTGDSVDVVLTPVGADGLDGDGCDGTLFSMEVKGAGAVVDGTLVTTNAAPWGASPNTLSTGGPGFLYFDSANGADATYVDTNLTPADLGIKNAPYTMMARVLQDALGDGDNADAMVFGQATGNVLHNGARGEQLHLGHWGNDISGGSVVLQEWRHISWVYDGNDSGTVSIYVNGTEVASDARGPFAEDGTILIGTTRLDQNRDFIGCLDDVRIYCAALSSAQITSIACESPNADCDGDGMADGAEIEIFGTTDRDGTLDLDGDRLNDATELLLGTDPNNRDTDGDGLWDGSEVIAFNTDPMVTDSDGDGLGDANEITMGTDPTDEDSDNDGRIDGSEAAGYSQNFNGIADDTTDLGDGSIIFSNNGPAKVLGEALQLTEDGVGSTSANFKLPVIDFTGGFHFHADLALAGGGDRPADGLSINFGPIADDAEFGEDGPGTGLTVSFDIWDNGGDAEGGQNGVGIDVKVDGTDISSVRAPDTAGLGNNTAVGSGIYEFDGVFRPVDISYTPTGDGTGVVSVHYGGQAYHENVAIGFTPAATDRFAIGARTGGAFETVWIDNLSVNGKAATTHNGAPELLVHYDFNEAVAGGGGGGGMEPKNILFVSFHTDGPSEAAAGAGFTEAPDIAYTNLLESLGHTVTRYQTKDDPTADDLAVYNAADLVILSRSVSSGNYQQEAEFWNTMVTAPVVSLGGYPLRDSRLNWTDGGTMVDSTGDIVLVANAEGHPVLEGVDLSQAYATTIEGQRGLSFNNNMIVGGTLIASVSDNGEGIANAPAIAEFAAGATVNNGNVLAGDRYIFLTGSREADGVSSETAGIYDLTETGAQLMANLINHILADPAAGLVDVTAPGDSVEVVSGENDDDENAGDPPAAEGVENAINDIGQKYLNFLDLGSGLVVTPAAGESVVQGIRLYTANDAVERDPASYRLEGANGGDFELIAEGGLALPDARNEGGDLALDPATSANQVVLFDNANAYTSYRLTFPTLKDAAAANSMQIAEIELLVAAPGGGGSTVVLNQGTAGDGVLVGADDLAGLIATPLGEPTAVFTEFVGADGIPTFDGAYDGADLLDGTWWVMVDFEAKMDGGPELIFETGGGTIGTSLVYEAPSTLVMRSVGNGGNDVITARAPLSQEILDAGAVELIFTHDANDSGPEGLAIWIDRHLVGHASGEKSNDFSGGNGASFGLGTASLAAGGGNTNLPGGSSDFVSGTIMTDPGLYFFRDTLFTAGSLRLGGVNGEGAIYVDTQQTSDALGINGAAAAYTMTARINPASIEGDNMVFGQLAPPDEALHNGLRANQVHFGHWGSDSNSGSAVVTPGQWYNVAWRFANGVQDIFLDGEHVGSSSQPRGLANPSNLLIGISRNDGAFEGLIDDVKLYAGALSTDAIHRAFDNEDTAASLLVRYEFEDGITTTVRNHGNKGAPDGVLNSTDVIGAYMPLVVPAVSDQIHGGPSGEIPASPSAGGPGIMHFNAEGNGADSTYVDTGVIPSEAGIQNAPYTMMAWVRQTSLGDGDNNDAMVFGQASGNVLHNGARGTTPHQGHWGNDISGGSIVLDQWTHYAWTYNGAETGTLTIWQNGQAVATGEAGGLSASDDPILIGSTRLDQNRDFIGQLDDVRIYCGALNAEQIIQEAGLVDSDGDGLLDPFERSNFGSLIANAEDDPDGDGLSNADEQRLGLNPIVSDANFIDADADGWTLGDEDAYGTSDGNPNSVPEIFVGGGQWEVRIVQADGVEITDVNMAEQLLNGEIAAAADNTTMHDFINFGDAGGAAGSIGDDVAWPQETEGDTEDFVMEATATIEVTETADYSLSFPTDDGMRYYINGEVVDEFVGTRGAPGADATTITLRKGRHEVRLVQFERGGGDNAEFAGTIVSENDLSGLGGGGYQLVPAAGDEQGGGGGASPLAEGLLAYYPFDGDLEDKAGDSHGEAVGADPIEFAEGQFGQGIDLNGAQHVITPQENENLFDFSDGTGFAVSAWFRVDAFDKSWQAIVTKGEGSNWRVHRRGDTSHLGPVAGPQEGNATSGFDMVDGPDVDDGAIHNVIIINDPAVGTSYYLDGVLAGQGPAGAPQGNDFPMMIGENADGGGNGRQWNGLIDDVAVWNRPLSEEEVLLVVGGPSVGEQIAAGASGPPEGLLAYWDFNQGEGDPVDLVSGSVATLSGGAAYGQGPGGDGDGAIDFGVTSEGQTLIADPDLLHAITDSDAFTVSFWQNLHAVANSSAFWVDAAEPGDRALQAHTPWGDGNIYFDTAGCCDAGSQRISGPGGLTAGTWQHLTFVKDGSFKGVYVDGVEIFSGENVAPIPAGFLSFSIGSANDGGNSIQGMIDEFSIWSVALSAGEIADLAAGGKPYIPGAGGGDDPRAAAVAQSSGPLTGPMIVDFGAIEGDASYEFAGNFVKGGASTAIAGNAAWGLKIDQWNEQGVFGTTEFGVADNVFETPSVFGEDVHIVYVADSAAGETRLYINGALAGTTGGAALLSGEVTVLGARDPAIDVVGDGTVLHGWATYNTALTDAEVAALAASPFPGGGAGGPQPIHHWPLDEITDGVSPDVVGGADMTAVNLTADNVVEGAAGNAIAFSNADQTLLEYIAPAGEGPLANRHENFTITFWTKIKGTGQNDLRVISEGSTTNTTPLFNLGTANDGADDSLDVYIRTVDNGNPYNHPHTTGMPFDDTWHHIAWSQAGGFATIYIDGVADGLVLETEILEYGGDMDTTSIGGIRRADPSHWVTGLIDEVKIFDVALTAEEVAADAGVDPAPAPAALDIVFVSFHDTDGPSEAAAAADPPLAEAADKGYTDLLTANGHNVTRWLTRDDPTADDLAALNAADLVIISRSVSSGNYAEEAEFWNTMVTAPVMNLGGYTWRSSRLNWTDGTTMADSTGPISLVANESGHPIFDGVDVASMHYANFIEGERGVSFNMNAIVGGTVLASVTDDGSPVANGPAIVEFATGATVNNGNVLAGPRIGFLTGSRELDRTSETAGLYDLTELGEHLFLNAVNYLGAGGAAAQTSSVKELVDSDRDGMADVMEAIAGTDPNSPMDYLHIQSIQSAAEGITIQFDGVEGKAYAIEFSETLEPDSWQVIGAENGNGTGVQFLHTTEGESSPQGFYRARVVQD